MLCLTLKDQEKIMVGDTIVIQVLEISNKQVKLGIVAPKDVRVDREKIREKIKLQEKTGCIRYEDYSKADTYKDPLED